MATKIDRIVGEFGQPIVFIFKNIQLDGATAIVIHAKKPNKQVALWTITVPGDVDTTQDRATYALTASTLDQKGPWQLQAWITHPTKLTKTIPVILEVGESLE